MKETKLFYVFLIALSISLLLFGGCISPVEPQPDNQQNQANSEPQNNPQDGEEDMPQPPALPEG